VAGAALNCGDVPNHYASVPERVVALLSGRGRGMTMRYAKAHVVVMGRSESVIESKLEFKRGTVVDGFSVPFLHSDGAYEIDE
jgi:hypothetical protein